MENSEKVYSYTPTLEFVTILPDDAGTHTVDRMEDWGSTNNHDEALEICKQIANEVHEYSEYYLDRLNDVLADFYEVTITVDEKIGDDFYVLSDVEEIEDVDLKGVLNK